MAHTLETRRFKDVATARSRKANPPPVQTGGTNARASDRLRWLYKLSVGVHTLTVHLGGNFVLTSVSLGLIGFYLLEVKNVFYARIN